MHILPSNDWSSLRSNTSHVTRVFSSRKDIWENFPVSLVQLGRGSDGADRHAVVWNRKNLVEWRKTSPYTDWSMYEIQEENRLLQAISKSTKWTVEPPIADNQICVIRMEFGQRKHSSKDVFYRQSNVPILTCLKDIMTFFPMTVYHEQPVMDDRKVYSIALFKKKLQEIGYMEATIRSNILRALKATTAWSVLPGMGDELCRIQMSSKIKA